MAAVTSLVFNIFLCVLLGVILATQELPLAIILAGLGAWVLLLVKWFVNRHRSETITSKGEWIGLVCLVLILVGAHLAPVKTYTTVLDMPVSLPRLSVSLGELDGPQSQSVTNLRFVLVDLDRADPSLDLTMDTVIEFPCVDLTLREFIAAIESQTPLRHAFHRYWHGYTILRGSRCYWPLKFAMPQ